MGKIILEFDSLTEEEMATAAINGMNWKRAIQDLDQKLRDTTKYGSSVVYPEASSLEIEIAEKYRDILREIVDSYNLNLD